MGVEELNVAINELFGIEKAAESIDAAWVVVEEMRRKGMATHVGNQNNGHVWTVQFCPGYIKDWEDGIGETAPLAICRASLLAVNRAA